jgi:hypothetical protein
MAMRMLCGNLAQALTSLLRSIGRDTILDDRVEIDIDRMVIKIETISRRATNHMHPVTEVVDKVKGSRTSTILEDLKWFRRIPDRNWTGKTARVHSQWRKELFRVKPLL